MICNGFETVRSLREHFLVDDNQDEQDENSDDSTGYEALLVHPGI